MNENVGKCTCGEVEYELTAPPIFVHCCHCTWCQRETGSAFAINALIESDQVKLIKGHPEKIHTPSNSGVGQDISRCPSCKTALWSNYGAAKETVSFIRAGTLNSPQAYSPDIHIFTSTKQNWVQLDDSVPVMEEYYQRSKYWPENSIIRYKNAIKAIQAHQVCSGASHLHRTVKAACLFCICFAKFRTKFTPLCLPLMRALG